MKSPRPRHHIGKIILAETLTVRQIMRILDWKLTHNRYFDFNGQQLEYFFHSYNCFRVNERTIEVPIIRYYLEQGHYQNVLEVGNVTNHYYDYFRQAFVKKTTVDKGERAYDVINMDIGLYHPDTPFDFVFSISTFEHMDSDRGRNRDYVKGSSTLISFAADNILHVSRALLRDGGKFVLTVPLGYAREWDETAYSGVLDRCGFASCKMYVYTRVNELTWKQVRLMDVDTKTFNYLSSQVNHLSIVEFDK